jgi:hypothetical protein
MPTSYRGHFLWHELLTSDPEAAKTFYRKVVGWTTAPWKDSSYTILMTDQTPNAGVMLMPAEVKAMGVPPHWATYIGTDDVDATVGQARTLGARVLKDPEDLPDVGRFAVVQDPQGAAFTVFTPSVPGVPTYPAPIGGFSWNELATTDWEAAFAFYSALFGWRKGQGMDMGPMGIYQIFELNGVMLGGIFNKPPEIPVSNWLPYARVKDTAAAAAAIKAAGGKVVNGPMDVPGGSIVQGFDPQGALFAVHAEIMAAPAPKPRAAKPAAAKSAAAKRSAAKPRRKATAKKATKPAKKPARKPAKRKAAAKATRKKPAKRSASRPKRRR